VSLAIAIASSSVLKRNSGATGPKVSSRATRICDVTSVRMVGSKNSPPRAWRLPPSASFAPLASASATCSSTLVIAAGSISGPIVTPSSVPAPTLNWPTRAASLVANSS